MLREAPRGKIIRIIRCSIVSGSMMKLMKDMFGLQTVYMAKIKSGIIHTGMIEQMNTILGYKVIHRESLPDVFSVIIYPHEHHGDFFISPCRR